MNNAEFRSRLTDLGLSLRQLATLKGWDYRELRRAATGEVSVTTRTVEAIKDLESQAVADMAKLLAESANGPVTIPWFSDEKGHIGMPGSYWHALAGKAIKAHGIHVTYAGKDPQ